MKDLTIIIPMALSALSLIISSLALYISWSQNNIDYNKSIVIESGVLPITTILEGENVFELKVTNTSKTNIKYYLKAETNIGFFERDNSKPQFIPHAYESQTISLSKSTVGANNSYSHKLNLDARYDRRQKNTYLSPAEYYLDVTIIDADNGKTLFNSSCFYSFHLESKRFLLDQPIIETTGESKARQKFCQV